MATKNTLYKTLNEIVAPEHTTLVVWDVQNALVNSSFNKDEFLKNIKSFIAVARSHKIPVLYTKITPLPLEYEAPFRLYLQMKRAGVDDPAKLLPFMKPGTFDSEIHVDVTPAKGDMVLNKGTTSIFIGTYFENMMRNSGTSTIIFTGITTEIGIESSARDSSARGFYTIVVDDCVSSADKEAHASALKTMSKVCLVMPSKDIVQAWK